MSEGDSTRLLHMSIKRHQACGDLPPAYANRDQTMSSVSVFIIVETLKSPVMFGYVLLDKYCKKKGSIHPVRGYHLHLCRRELRVSQYKGK